MTPTEVRLAMKAAGFQPIPCNGKRPTVDAWTTLFDVTAEEMATWVGLNTGMLCGLTTAWDTDIMHEEAAEAVATLVKDWFDGRGIMPVRTGQAPKWATLFRTDHPFSKMVAHFEAPNGDAHKIEILGQGQQLVVAGTHPDTKKDYTWHGGCPWEIQRDDLPEITEEEAREVLELAATLLVEEFRFRRTAGPGKAHGNGGDTHAEWKAPTNVDQLLADVEIGIVHDTELSATASLLRRGLSVDAAVLTVMEDTRKTLGSEAAAWDWEKEELTLRRQCTDFVNKHPELSALLPDDLRDKFESALSTGKKPKVIFSKHIGWHIRGYEGKDNNGAHTAEDPTPHTYRFRLEKFSDLRLGMEPPYLVEELIPIAGLVDVWGKAKCYKSFWTLDLMLHVAMGWEYRDRIVRQGPVVYCAFEGGHGYDKRSEALRRHYNLPADANVPLYLLRGNVNLIAEHRLLLADIAAQVGDTQPVAVVLDTLNKSLVGSENKDVDMGAYVRAAEAIRDKFGCVVIIVHHCGYDETRPRGHSSLPGAVDAQLAVVRAEEIVTVTVEFMRDGPEDIQVVSAAEVVEVGEDRNGKTLTSLVVVPSEAEGTSAQAGSMARGLTVFVAALKAALAADGEVFQPEAGVLPVRAVQQWRVRDRFYKTYAEAEEDEKKRQEKIRKAFNRALGDGQTRKLFRVQNSDAGEAMLWLPERGS